MHLLHPLIHQQHLFSVLQIQIINKAADIEVNSLLVYYLLVYYRQTLYFLTKLRDPKWLLPNPKHEGERIRKKCNCANFPPKRC